MLVPLTLLLSAALAAMSGPRLSTEDSVRIREFDRLAANIQDRIWTGWSKVPAPVLLITAKSEFLIHDPSTPAGFEPIGDGVAARPRQFPPNMQATFPAFGPEAVIIIGEPEATASRTSTPWLITLLHEHFHQLQFMEPRYVEAVKSLGLARGDSTGMWMLNYPFPYGRPEVAQAFRELRDRLLAALTEKEPKRFDALARGYVEARSRFLAGLSDDDHRYFSFQLWQEGIARYTEIRSAEEAARYEPTPAFARLADFEPFAAVAARARSQTLAELAHADLPDMKRVAFYSFGAAEGLLLDRLHPRWRESYFRHLLTTDPLFAE